MRYMIGSRIYERPDIINFHEESQGFYAELDHLSCLAFEGEQALKMLQSQLTNNLLSLKQNTLQNNLLCNLKGQIISKVRVINYNSQIHIICPQDLSEDIQAILEKPAAFARLRFTTIKTKIFGIFQPKAIEAQYFCLNSDAGLSFSPPQNLQQRSSLEWHFQRLRVGDFEIYPETCKMFHPHDLELEKSDWINFNKGCYRGQEIIARMHYRGKRKYQLTTVTLDASHLQPGLEIPTGIVVDFCPINSQQNLVLLRSKIS